MPDYVVPLSWPQLCTVGACGPRDFRTAYSALPVIMHALRYGDPGRAVSPLLAAATIGNAQFQSTGDGAIGAIIGTANTTIIGPPPSIGPSANILFNESES